MSDKATQVVHALASGKRLELGQKVPQGEAITSYLANDRGVPIDSSSGNRTWHYDLASGRRLWGEEGSDALDTSVTRPDATAKTMSVNLINVKAGDRLFVRVTGTGSRGERLDDLPGNNAYFDLVPTAGAGTGAEPPTDPITALEDRLNARFDKIEAGIKSLGGTVA